MRRRVNAILMAVLLIITPLMTALCSVVTVHAAEGVTIKLHYHRADDAYDGWDVWFWEEGGAGGAGFPFTEEDGEMVSTKEVTPGISSVGFIVRTEDWLKDYDGDQFIDISEVISGTVHIYVESGEEGYTKEYGDDVVTGIRLRAATYNNDSTVTVVMTGEITDDLSGVFTVADKEGEIAVTDVTAGADATYIVALAEPLDSSKSYTITFEDITYDIYLPSVYSTPEFEEQYTYTGDDLGATWSESATSFRLWAPTAESVSVILYDSGTDYEKNIIDTIEMAPDVNGTWIASKDGDLRGVYYTYSVVIDGVQREACDPYARTTGVNGERAMIINLEETNPEGWDQDTNPNAGKTINDAVIYELHVRDLSSGSDSGIENKGKFLGLTETGTKTASGVSTGLDHIKELGVTHLHLLPIYDFGSVDEKHTITGLFNWGYDPVNYNVPEGSYSTDPFNGEVRVKELKQTVKTLHDNDVSVIMDVVYNHVYSTSDFCFNKIVPDYFSRIDGTGAYSNGSGCGNDTASERSMVKKYIVDSVCYWADEYHIDGFRFDLVGLLDTETINEIIVQVHKDHPDVIFYGEGWTMNTSVTKDGYTLATQVNSAETPEFAYFNDTIRDGLKGSVFDDSDPGYASGKTGMEETITNCFLGADSWCNSPSQTINYASCHDNLTLFDHLQTARPDASREDLIRMNNLAAAVYMTAEGTPFMQAGEEMLRTKQREDGTFDSNSYSSGDQINSLKWSDLDSAEYAQVFEYYKGLIAFRKAHGALRLTTAEDVAAAVAPVDGLDSNVVAFDIRGDRGDEAADELFVIFNANESETSVTLPEGSWNIYINAEKAGTKVIETVSGTATVAPISAMVLVRESGVTASSADTEDITGTAADVPADMAVSNGSSSNTGAVAGIAVAIVAAVGAAVGIVFKKRKK